MKRTMEYLLSFFISNLVVVLFAICGCIIYRAPWKIKIVAAITSITIQIGMMLGYHHKLSTEMYDIYKSLF